MTKECFYELADELRLSTLCPYFFLDNKRKRNILGEIIPQKFEDIFGEV